MALVAVFASTHISAQDIDIDNVPMEVMSTLNLYYAEATHVTFEMKKGNYEADFKMDGKDYSALFSPKGEWLQTEYEIKVSELPKAVSQAIKKTYPEYRIDDVDKIEAPKDNNRYKVELEKGESEIEIFLNEKGEILKMLN